MKGASMFRSPRVTQVFLSSALCALAGPSIVRAGDVVGRVELTEKGGKKATDLSDVLIYVDASKTKAKPGKEAASITMRSKAFTPHVLVIGAGTTVEFPNEDPILHNVFSVSGEGFDLGLYKRPKSGSRIFDKPGTYTLYCNIHPQMSAVVVVRDNPYFAKADKDGSFRMTGLPAGEHRLVAWHERAGESQPLSVKVTATGETQAALSLDATSYKRVPHKNKSGKDYGKEVY